MCFASLTQLNTHIFAYRWLLPAPVAGRRRERRKQRHQAFIRILQRPVPPLSAHTQNAHEVYVPAGHGHCVRQMLRWDWGFQRHQIHRGNVRKGRCSSCFMDSFLTLALFQLLLLFCGNWQDAFHPNKIPRFHWTHLWLRLFSAVHRQTGARQIDTLPEQTHQQ